MLSLFKCLLCNCLLLLDSFYCLSYYIIITHITAMVDESSQASFLSSIDDIVQVHPEQIATANTSCFISLLSNSEE